MLKESFRFNDKIIKDHNQTEINKKTIQLSLEYSQREQRNSKHSNNVNNTQLIFANFMQNCSKH